MDQSELWSSWAPKGISFLIESLRKWPSLSLVEFLRNWSFWAWELPSSKWVSFLMKSLRKWTSLSLGGVGAPELQMGKFLNETIKEMDQSEPWSSWAPKGSVWINFLMKSLRDVPVWAWELLSSKGISFSIEASRKWISLSLRVPAL